MSQVILRKTNQATVTAADAIALITSAPTRGRVISHSGNNLLADVPDHKIGDLSTRLAGWIVSEQGSAIPVPDSRLRARKR